ncbi:MAG TPA: MBL fold metallo-hydrolase [Bacteroidota bacterium]
MKKSIVLACFACVMVLNGCSSVVTGFFMKSVEQIGRPVEPVRQRVQQPILPETDLSVLWVGHATVLIQIRDKVVLTDPLFTRTVGMVMKRTTEPGIDPASLARVDVTVISHTHFDHFSYGSLDMLPKNGSLLVPYGALRYTPDLGFAELQEMRPWDVLERDGMKITAVPVQHFSGRYGFDILWMKGLGYTGYVIEYRGVTIFYAGDTGYHPELFKEIGRRFDVDLAILPIGPIEPRDFMERNHIDPAQALLTFQDIGARFLLPMHHKTLVQGFDPSPSFAIEQLRTLAERMNLAECLVDLEIGEQRMFRIAASLEPAPTGNLP